MTTHNFPWLNSCNTLLENIFKMITNSNSKNIIIMSTTINNDITKVITEYSKNSKKKVNTIMLKILSQVDDYKKLCGIYQKNYEKYLKLNHDFDLLIHSKDNLSIVMDNSIDSKVGTSSSSHGVLDHIHDNVDIPSTTTSSTNSSLPPSSSVSTSTAVKDDNFMNRSLTKMLSKIAPEKKYDEKYKILVKEILLVEKTLEINSNKLNKQYKEIYIDIEKSMIDCIHYENNRIYNIKDNFIKFNLIFDNIIEQNSIMNTNLMSQIMLFDSENEAMNLMNEINHLSFNSNSNNSSNSSSYSNNNNDILGFNNDTIIDVKSVDINELFSKTEKLSEVMESLKLLLSRFITSLVEISEVEMTYAMAIQKCIDKYGYYRRTNNNNNNSDAGDSIPAVITPPTTAVPAAAAAAAAAAVVDSTAINDDTTTTAVEVITTNTTATTNNTGDNRGNITRSNSSSSSPVNFPVTLNEQSTSPSHSCNIATKTITTNTSKNNNNNNSNGSSNNINNNNNEDEDFLIYDKDTIEIIRYYDSIINCIHNFSELSIKTSELMNEDICSSLDIVQQRLDISGKQLLNKLQNHMKIVDNIKSYDIRIKTKLDKLQVFLFERKTTLKQAKEKDMLSISTSHITTATTTANNNSNNNCIDSCNSDSDKGIIMSPVEISVRTEKDFPVSTEMSVPTEAVDYLNHSFDHDSNEVMIPMESVDDGGVVSINNVAHANTDHNDDDDNNNNKIVVAKEGDEKDQQPLPLSTASLSDEAIIVDNKDTDGDQHDLISLDDVSSSTNNNSATIHISTSNANDSNNHINQSSSTTPTNSTLIAPSSSSTSPITSSSLSSSLQRRTSMLETKLKIVVGLEKHSDRIQRIEKQIISMEEEEKELIQQCHQSSSSLHDTSILAINEIYQLFFITKDILITDLNTIKNTMELLIQCRQESLVSMIKLNQFSHNCYQNINIELCKNSFLHKIKNIFHQYTNNNNNYSYNNETKSNVSSNNNNSSSMDTGVASNQSSSSSSMILELVEIQSFTPVENELLSQERQLLILQQQVI